MPIRGDLIAAKKRYQYDYPIGTLQEFSQLPTSASTPEELRDIFYQYDIPKTLAAVAIGQCSISEEELRGQLPVPALVLHDTEYAKPSSESVVPSEGAIMAVYGLRKVVKNDKAQKRRKRQKEHPVFVPQKLGIHGFGAMPFELKIPLTPQLDLGKGRITAYHTDGIRSRIYDSYGNPKNDPSTPLQVINEFTRLHLKTQTLQELEGFLSELTSDDKASV